MKRHFALVHIRPMPRLHRRAPSRVVRIVLAAICAALLIVATPSSAQRVGDARAQLKVGLVLSGGSAKGFAHIGVLEELERAGVPIDVVTGTSMGSIVGGLYAIGYTPAMLRTVAQTEDWNGLFLRGADRNDLNPLRKLGDGRFLVSVPLNGTSIALPAALVGSQGVTAILSRLVWGADTIADFRRFPIPFAAVATDLATGDAVTLTTGPLSQAMRASMALPGVFAPVSIGGRRLVDGGVARNLPVQDARALGAELVICVDVSEPLEPADSLTSAFGILMQVMTYRMQSSTRRERTGCDVLIEPDIRGLSSTTFDQGERWIARGAAAARAALPAVLDLLRSRGVHPSDSQSVYRARHPWTGGRLPVRRIRVPGNAGATAALVLPLSGDDARMSATDVEEIANRLYASGRYALVAWHLSPAADGVNVELEVVPSNPNRIGLGLRYDTRYKAALLFGAEMYDRLGAGSSLSIEARLGEQVLVQARLQPGARRASRFIRAASASYIRTPLDILLGGLAVARADVQVVTGSAFVGVVAPSSTISGLQLAVEHGRSGADIVATPVRAVSQRYATLSALTWTDTYDRAAFPTRGMSIFAQGEVAERAIGSGATFHRLVFDSELRLPLHPRTSAFVHVTAGAAGGVDLPLYDLFFLGGISPSAVLPARQFTFPGLDDEELRGRAIQLGAIGVQQSLTRSVFLTATGTAGKAFDQWPAGVRLSRYRGSASVSLGYATPIGPASLTVASGRLGERPRVGAEIGFRF